ncbi:MAG: sulfatase-like hydrolase/transferase [Thermoanaerobacterales bacterium]
MPAVAPGGRDEHRRSGDGAGDGTVAPPAGPARGRLARAARVLRDEALLALELAGLLALAVTRPVLDSFGRSPETFLARGATARDVVAFGVLVAVVPALALSSVGVASRLGGRRVRGWCHSALVGLAGGLAVWRLGVDATAWGRALVAGAAVAAGAVLLVARHRSATLATYLRFLGVASVGFLVQFLALSPTGELVVGGGGVAGVLDGETALPAEAGDLPPVVVVVLDALPTTSLLDGHGRIDADLFPNLAALADDATWYRNHTTTALHTFQAVPSMLSGRLPSDPSPLPDHRNFPHNLFTLLGGTHDVEAVEQLTRLCPEVLCPPTRDGALGALLGDAVEWWRGGLEEERATGAQILPGALEPDRLDEFLAWIEDQDFTPGDRPGLWFYHLVLPHEPYHLLDDGSRYEVVEEDPYGLFLGSIWHGTGVDVARQRHLLQLQAVDHALGVLIDRLREADAYDSTLLVVVGDHGEAFAAGEPRRGVGEAQPEQVAWTPLLIKAPGQTEGAVDDANVLNVDLVPTIAELMGLAPAWDDVDGVPASQADAVRGVGKPVLHTDFDTVEPEDDGEFVVLDAAAGLERVLAADPVPGEGELAIWQRTEHGSLVGRSVDELDVGPDRGAALAVRDLDRLEDPGDGPPVLEVIGETDLPEGEVVAVAVDGVVAAVAPVQPAPWWDEGRVVHALLLPDALGERNTLEAYAVEGPPGRARLRPLTVTAG